jgi:hypothetical protein
MCRAYAMVGKKNVPIVVVVSWTVVVVSAIVVVVGSVVVVV